MLSPFRAFMTALAATIGTGNIAGVATAFDASFPGGGWVVAVCVFLFGYTTLIGWAYYGEQFLEYVLGAISKVDTVWAWGDLMNGFQIFPNLVGVIGLSGVAAATLRERPRRSAAA